MPEGMMQVFDERGRRVLISRCDWAEKVLPQNFQKTWDDADALYAVVVGALSDGFLDCVLPAIARLIEIDPRPGRAAAVLASAQMKGGRLDDAERTLRDSILKHGETGVVLTILAKVLAARGEPSFEETLRRGLSLDPNQENGLDWYALLRKERGGPEAYRAALEDVAREPGAWQPLLRLGQSFLEGGDTSRAVDSFRSVLSAAPAQSGAWTAITGALGQAGLGAELAALCGPLYDPGRNPPAAGADLARAWLETGRLDEARALVERLRGLGGPPLRETLDSLEKALASARARPSVEASPLALIRLESPVWARGLGDPPWLLPKAPAGAKRLTFLSFADETRRGESPLEQTEDDRGRLSRALPLFLSEALAFKSGLRTECVVPLSPGKGLGLCKTAWDVPDLLARGRWERPPDLVVSGAFVPGLTGLTIELELWDAALGATLGRVALPAGDAPAATALELERELSALLSGLKLAVLREPGWYRSPVRDGQGAYLQALSHLLNHVLAAEGVLPPGRLWNEPGMLESYYYHCEQHPSPVCKLLAICGTLCSLRLGSSLAEPHRGFLLKMLAGEEEAGPVTRLTPLVFLRLGERKAFEIARERLGSSADPEYRDWLAALQ